MGAVARTERASENAWTERRLRTGAETRDGVGPRRALLVLVHVAPGRWLGGRQIDFGVDVACRRGPQIHKGEPGSVCGHVQDIRAEAIAAVRAGKAIWFEVRMPLPFALGKPLAPAHLSPGANS